MKLTERLFALKNSVPFNRLGDSELALVSQIARVRNYQPGERISSSGRPLQKLFTVVRGEVTNGDGLSVRSVFGVRSLLFNTPLTSDLLACGTGGATCLLIGKGHFFRIMNEFPEFATGFLMLDQDDFCH